MGKLKDKDFKKIKVVIGKKKPSNNVTKFNIKTSKIVIPGQNRNNIERKPESSTNSENYLNEKLNQYLSALVLNINKKKQTKEKLDLTQSIWKSSYKPRWLTPWENIFEEYHNTIGPLELNFWEIINNCVNQKIESLNVLSVRVLNLYNELFGESSNSFHASKETISIIRKLMTAADEKKKILGLGVILYLSKYSPFSFWYPARQRSAVFILNILQNILSTLGKEYQPLLSQEQFLDLSVHVISSVIDGRKSGYLIVGEDHSQIQDFENPPFGDTYYVNSDYVNIERRNVTDSFDKCDPKDISRTASFDLGIYLSRFSDGILKLGLKMLPISLNCEESLTSMKNIIKILSRVCMRTVTSPLWIQFVNKLLEQIPFEDGNETDTSVSTFDDRFEPLEYGDMTGMSNKERKRYKAKINLENQMREACRSTATETNNSTKVVELRDDINYYVMALIHQCLVSHKLTEVSKQIDNWLTKTKNNLMGRQWTRNELMFRWMRLAKQALELAYSRYSALSSCTTELLVCLSRHLFVSAHRNSKVKRLALATFVTACLESQRLSPFESSIKLPVVDQLLWTELVSMVANETMPDRGINQNSTDSSTRQSDVTVVRAAYLLLQRQYPNVVAFFRVAQPAEKACLKAAFEHLRLSELRARPLAPHTMEQFRTENNKQPTLQLWHYFSNEQICRPDALLDQLEPLCSSIDLSLCQ